MLLLKVSALLLAVVCQMKSCSAAPARAAPDSLSDRVSLVDFEAGRLWSAILKSVEQMTEDLEPDSSVALRKRACNTATCVTHRLADFLSRAGGIGHTRFVATDVGSRAFGRRRRS
ncbi:calcitonin gene-related peptide 1-like isoform X2 [Danio rerio]|uniref:Calcitonin gene-related peptide 1-like isoform X2 n=3 Tax=Danio rerio TaxID=7955 RepID=A0AC58IZD3_DANRE